MPRVIQLSATDARLLNSWMPEGKRVPVGTSYATDGKRLFVTTENGISVLEPKSMLELVELRGSTEERYSVSAGFSSGLAQLIQPTFSSGIGKPAALNFLRPKSDKSVSIFDALAASAKKHNQQTLDASQKASEAAQTLIKASKLSAGPSPTPVPNLPAVPATPTAEVKKKLVELKSDVEQVDLIECEFEVRTIGDPPVPENVRGKLGDFKVGNEVFPKGLWAHAPSHYVFKLPPGWSTLTTMFGLEEGRTGSVAFVILGDGKPLYRSSIIRDHILHGITVDVRGVKLLELVTEQTDQGNKEDWGLWLEPRLLRKPSPDVYPHRFAELKVKVEKLDGCDIQISAKGLEVIGLKNSDPTITVNGAAWKPKSQKLFPNEGSNQYLDGDLDYARARVHLHEVTGGGNLSYAYAADHVRIEMSSVTNGSSDFELVIQIPKRIDDLTTVDTVPFWGGPWKVAGWEYTASWWGELPAEVPPKATKPFGVAEFDFVDWNEANDVFPTPQTRSDHFVLIGERKFKSDGGLYRIDTIADDGIRIELDGKSVVERWKMQGVAQDVKMLEIPAGIHTLRFEYVDAVGRARVGVMLRCMEPKGTELKRKVVELSTVQRATHKPLRDSIAKLRALGAYVHEELNSPTPLVTEVNLQVATSKVDNLAIAALRNLPDVRALAFGANEIEPKAWSQLASLKNLRELALIYGAFDTEALTEIAKLESLETLALLGSGIDDEKLKLIAKVPKIRSLSLWYLKATDSCIDTVAGMSALRHFDFGGTEITEAGVEKLMLARPDLQLSHGLKLRPGTVIFEISPMDEKAVFTIDGKEYRRADLEQPIEIAAGKHSIVVTLGGKQLFAEPFSILPNQRKIVVVMDADRKAALRVLQLGGTANILVAGQATDIKPGEELPDLPLELNAINLWGNQEVRDEDLRLFENLSGLTAIGLSGSQVTDNGIRYVPGAKLTVIDLTNTKITEGGLDALLSKIPALNHLLIANLPVTDRVMSRVEAYPLSLFAASGTQIGDAGVSYLRGKQMWGCGLDGTRITDRGLQNMEGAGFDNLTLSDTNVTDAGLEHCKKFTKLAAINLKNTKVTDAGVTSLQQFFPECKIER